MCENVHVWVGGHSNQKGAGVPGAGVICSCEPADVGAEKQTLVLWKSRMRS